MFEKILLFLSAIAFVVSAFGILVVAPNNDAMLVFFFLAIFSLLILAYSVIEITKGQE